MNQPIVTLTPDAVPYRPPTLGPNDTERWDPDVFVVYRLPLTNRLGGYIDLKSEAPKPNGTKKRKPRRTP